MMHALRYLCVSILLMQAMPSLAYWSCAWPYRTQVQVQEVSGNTLTQYQVKLNVTGALLNASYNWTTNGFDFRVVDSGDDTLLDFWVEDWDQGAETAVVWVRFNTLAANQNKTIYLYYGNQFADQLANVPFTFIEPGIKFHTRRVTTNPNSLTQAKSLFDAAGDANAGYGCTFITNFTGVENSIEFGSNTNFIAYSETYFEVKAGESGNWGIRYGADFGGGGGLYVDGIPLEEDWLNDLWWSNNWGNADVLQGTISLTEGYHKLEVIGQEGGNDGGITVQYQKPGSGTFQTYSTTNIDIRSRACPVNEPVVTFGAQSTATCPAALASYRLDEGSWGGIGDVVDQTANFPGTMLGAINEIANENVCNSAQVTPNNQGNTVSAIQTGMDLDADVGPVGSFAFWVKLNNNWNDGQTRKILDASLLPTGVASEKYFFVEKLAAGNFDFRFEDSADGDFQILEPTGANRLANQWYHVTVTFDFPNNQFQIYVDETLVADSLVNLNGGGAITSGAITDLNTLQFGDKIPSPSLGGTGRSADGAFDEINIYNSVLSISEIRGLMAKTRSCSAPVIPRACLGSFPNAVNSIKNRIINFGENAQVLNNPDNTLSAKTINKTSYSTLLTCDTLDCIPGDDEVNDVKPSNFQKTTASNDVTVASGGSLATPLGTSTNEFDKLTINYAGTLDFTSANYSEFFIDELITISNAIINFSPGTYWINNINLSANVKMNVIGGGPVRLYINKVNSWSSDILINSPAYGVAGNPQDLLMYFYKQVNMGVKTTISGSVFVTQDINTSQQSRIFGLMTGENVTIGLGSQVSYDVSAYYGMSDISWCDAGAVTIDSFAISAPATAINCLPASIDIQILDASGAVIPDYVGDIALTTNTAHGDWSLGAGALGVLTDTLANDGVASYSMVAADAGTVTLQLKNTHPENTIITFTSNGISATQAINFQAAGFVFTPIANQISAKQSVNYTITAVETDLTTGTCAPLLINNQNIDMAMECLSPSNCGAANSSINATTVAKNLAGSVTNFTPVSLDFGDATDSNASFNLTYSDAGQVRLHARFALRTASGAVSGNYISGSSNNFVVVPAGFCIQPNEVSTNWQCTSPGLTASCSAYKQAGENFNLSVVAKAYNGASVDYCNNAVHGTTVNFSGAVNVSHNLVSPTVGNGGEAGTFSASSVNLAAGTSSTAVNFSEMGVFTVNAGGNTYLAASLPSNTSSNIGRFYPKDFHVVASTPAIYDNGNTGFTYIGQLESDNITGAISYLTPPTFTYVVRGFNNQILNNYLTPFNAIPVASVTASSAIIGNSSALTLTAGFNVGSITGPNASDQFVYQFSSSDHFVFDRNANSLINEFTNDTQLTLNGFSTATDSTGLSTASYVINGSGGLMRYGRIQIDNAYGPETLAVPQLFHTQYYNGQDFIENSLDSGTAYDLVNINTITVIDSGDAGSPLLTTDSSISGVLGNTGTFNVGKLNARWSATVNGHYGTYRFTYTAPSWLKYEWDTTAGDDDPTGEVTFGQYRGHDKIIYWKEINY